MSKFNSHVETIGRVRKSIEKYTISVIPNPFKKGIALFDWDATICDWFKYPEEFGIPKILREGLSKFSRKVIVGINTARNYETLGREIKNTRFGMLIDNGIFQPQQKDFTLQKVQVVDSDNRKRYYFGMPAILELGGRIATIIREKDDIKFIEFKAFYISEDNIKDLVKFLKKDGYRTLSFYSNLKGQIFITSNKDYFNIHKKDNEKLEFVDYDNLVAFLLENKPCLIDVINAGDKSAHNLEDSDLNYTFISKEDHSYHISGYKYNEKTNRLEKVNKGSASQELAKIFTGIKLRKRKGRIEKVKESLYAPNFTAGDNPDIDDDLHNQHSIHAFVVGKRYKDKVLKHKKEGGPKKIVIVDDPEHLGKVLLKMSKGGREKAFDKIKGLTILPYSKIQKLRMYK